LTFKQHSNESVYIVFNVRLLNVSPGYTCIHSLCSFLESLTVHLVAFEYSCALFVFSHLFKSLHNKGMSITPWLIHDSTIKRTESMEMIF